MNLQKRVLLVSLIGSIVLALLLYPLQQVEIIQSNGVIWISIATLIILIGFYSFQKFVQDSLSHSDPGEFSSDRELELAENFSNITTELSELLQSNEQKIRMEKELETAKTVQEYLFPIPQFKSKDIEVIGYYHPATECGGDWWYYSEDGDKLYIWIGDATGHGAPAALITSAIRSAVTIIEQTGLLSPSVSMSLLNASLCAMSPGKMCMTFFIAYINRRTNQMTYCNASHEPPILIEQTNAKPTMRNIKILQGNNNYRLGDNANSEFEQTTVDLNPGDRFLLYTDGLTDLKNPEGNFWGESKFFKATLPLLSHKYDLKTSYKGILQKMEEYKGDAELIDDVTFVLFQYK